MYFKRRVSVLLVFALLGSTTVAEEMPEYATVGNWSVRVDTSLNYGCFLFAKYEKGSLVRLQIDPSDNSVYLLLGDPNWESIEYGKNYPVKLTFGDETPWTADAAGFSFDPPQDQPFLSITVSTEGDSLYTFVSEFMQESNFQLYYNDKSIQNLALRGSYKAALKLFECQKAANSLLDEQDPFEAPPARTVDDPFSS